MVCDEENVWVCATTRRVSICVGDWFVLVLGEETILVLSVEM